MLCSESIEQLMYMKEKYGDLHVECDDSSGYSWKANYVVYIVDQQNIETPQYFQID